MQNITHESCVICQENYNENHTNIVVTNCDHKYHCICLLHWLTIGKKCPYCNEPLVETNIQATNMEDLRKQIITEERIRQRRLVKVRMENLKNEIKPFLIRESGDLKYEYWNNFKEYCNNYNKTTEEVKDFINNNMQKKCEIVNKGNVLKIKGILSSHDIHTNFKIYFGIN